MQYELIKNHYPLYPKSQQEKSPEHSKRIQLLLQMAKRLGTRDTPLFQLLLFSKVKNYIRYIVIRKVYQSFQEPHAIRRNDENETIFESLMKLGIQLQVITQKDGTYSLSTTYFLEEGERANLIHFRDMKHEMMNELLDDYKFIEETIVAEPKTKLGLIMKKPNFIYLKEVLKYVQEINQLNVYHQVSPSFSEDFYTDLGELAFEIYTRKNYKAFMADKTFHTILDIGCGNGNYIDVHIESDVQQIVGVERQAIVYEKLERKYKSHPNVLIHNDDITHLTFEKKFDMINMSYMLFYLTDSQKEALFNHLKDILHEQGSIIVCQYYPDFGGYQEVIAKYHKRWTFISRYKYDICNSILQAEVVLNNMLVDFAQAEEWPKFLRLLNSCGFEVSDITPADDTYYSYFITIKHKTGGTHDQSYERYKSL